jgi:hypothetical protein
MVSVKAVRAGSGNPIPKCSVKVWVGGWDGGWVERTTDARAVALFETLSPGTYTVLVDGVENKGVYLEGEVVLYA